MLIINRITKITKPLLIASSSYFKLPTLVYNNRIWFSQKSRDKIIQIIEKSNIEENLEKIMAEAASLNDQLKEEVLEALLEKIFQKRLPPRIILDQKLSAQLKKYPHLHFQAYYFRVMESIKNLEVHIHKEDKKLNMLIAKEISDSFVICFQDLKKAQRKITAPKQIKLLRTFANYNFDYLSKLVDPKKKQECYNKSRQCYKLTLVKYIALLKNLLKDQKQLISRANPRQTLQQKEQRQDQLQQLELLKFQIVESYSQIVSEMLSLEEKLFLQKQQSKEALTKKQKENKVNQQEINFQFGKQTLWLEPAIQRALQNYQKIPHIKMQSNYYYRLRKIHLQVQKEIKLRELLYSVKTKQERKQQIDKIYQQTKEKINSIYNNILNQMKKIQSQQLQAEILADQIMVMISIKLEQFISKNKSEEGQQLIADEKTIGEQIQKLVNYIVYQDKKKKTLGLLIHKVKDIYGIKIDNYVQKVPRSLRTHRRRREQEGHDI